MGSCSARFFSAEPVVLRDERCVDACHLLTRCVLDALARLQPPRGPVSVERDIHGTHVDYQAEIRRTENYDRCFGIRTRKVVSLFHVVTPHPGVADIWYRAYLYLGVVGVTVDRL